MWVAYNDGDGAPLCQRSNYINVHSGRGLSVLIENRIGMVQTYRTNPKYPMVGNLNHFVFFECDTDLNQIKY